MPHFMPGLVLSQRFYTEVVERSLGHYFPDLQYAAARIGPGSEVLGFDTAMSMDHDWGPCLNILLSDRDAHLTASIHEMLCQELPKSFAGYPVDTSIAMHSLEYTSEAEVSAGVHSHRVLVSSLRAFIWQEIAHDIDAPLVAADWLTIASQKLLELTTGAVFYDNWGALTGFRAQLAYYPHDIWLYLLASAWQRIGQEEHLMPRAGYVGDELGSSIIGSRLVRDSMWLCFLMERRYAPYPKWFGSAFQQLHNAAVLTPILHNAQHALTWQQREDALCQAYEQLVLQHNALQITAPLVSHVSAFYTRPFRVIQGERLATALLEQIQDPEVQHIAANGLIGSIDQWSDNTDMRSDAQWRCYLRDLYVSRRPVEPGSG